MFFILSKLLNFVIQPLMWIFGCAYWGIVANHPRRRKYLWRICLVLLLFCSNRFITGYVNYLWEDEGISSFALPDSAAVGIVLGGFSDDSVLSPADGRLNFSFGANRLTDALMLFKMGKIKRILISGGNGDMLKKNVVSEAQAARQYLLQLGVADSCILIEPQSRNTHENALFTRKLLTEKGLANERLVLITSAQHIARASRCFGKVGLSVTPFATSFVGKKFYWGDLFIFSGNNIEAWQMLIKEWFGILAYKIQGYI